MGPRVMFLLDDARMLMLSLAELSDVDSEPVTTREMVSLRGASLGMRMALAARGVRLYVLSERLADWDSGGDIMMVRPPEMAAGVAMRSWKSERSVTICSL